MFFICSIDDTIENMGNTVGSFSELSVLITNCESAYVLGLWCADGYHRTSSIGLTNVDQRLANRFASYLGKLFPRKRIKWQMYYPLGKKPRGIHMPMLPLYKARQIVYRPYVNSRPLLRLFMAAEHQVVELPKKYIMAYFAGRFDGDGSVDENLRSDLRVAYSNQSEAKSDQKLLASLKSYKTCIYHYRGARTYVLYISRYNANQFLQDIKPYSVIAHSLSSRRDSSELPKVHSDGFANNARLKSIINGG